MLAQWNALTTMVKLVIAAVVVILVALAVWWFFIHPAHLRQEAATAKAQSQYSGAQSQSAKDAVSTLSAQQSLEAKRAQTTKEANDAINKTSGAKVPVAADTNDAGVRAICMRDNYRDTPRCRQVLGSPTP